MRGGDGQPHTDELDAFDEPDTFDEPDAFRESPIATPLGSTHVPPSQRVEEPRVLAPNVVYAFDDLLDAVDALESSPSDPHHVRLIRTLRALADVLALSAQPSARAQVDAVRRAADELAQSPVSSDWHTDYARYALEATLGVLQSLQLGTEQPFVEYRELVARYAVKLESIRRGEHLQDRYVALSDALRTASDALLLANGLTVPEVRRVAQEMHDRSMERGPG